MTKQITVGLGLLFAFGVGCGAGVGASSLVVPPASAQQRAIATKWEYQCVQMTGGDAEKATNLANPLGAQYWEMALVQGPVLCFKRPLP